MAAHLGEYLHLLAPAIVNIFESPENTVSSRMLAMQALANLCKELNFRFDSPLFTSDMFLVNTLLE